MVQDVWLGLGAKVLDDQKEPAVGRNPATRAFRDIAWAPGGATGSSVTRTASAFGATSVPAACRHVATDLAARAGECRIGSRDGRTRRHGFNES